MKIKFIPAFLVALATSIVLQTSSAQAQNYFAFLDGPSESPANASPGTGFAEVTLDLVLHTLQIDLTFSGLTGTTTAAHIHAPTLMPLTGTAGVATQTPSFTDFPLGVTSGFYSMTFDTLDLATYNPAFVAANGGVVAGAEEALAQALADGEAYLNIHTTEFPTGEIRGFLAVPEPASVGLFAIGGLTLLAAARRKRRS